MLPEITGVILAGGRATRMKGKDKGLIVVGNKKLYQYGLARLTPQVDQVIISANRNQYYYQTSGLPVISDITADYPGPLAGILAALSYSSTQWIVSIPCDAPDFPNDLVERLWVNKGDPLAAYANDGERDHPTFALLHKSLTKELTQYLAKGERKLMLFMELIGAERVIFSEKQEVFRNLNTIDDCQQWLQEKKEAR